MHRSNLVMWCVTVKSGKYIHGPLDWVVEHYLHTGQFFPAAGNEPEVVRWVA